MNNHRRTASHWLISQVLCFCLLLQSSGIAQALPLPPKQVFVSESALNTTPLASVVPDDESGEGGFVRRFVAQAGITAEHAGATLGRWLVEPWTPKAGGHEAPLRVAQAAGSLPLPARLMSVLMAASGRGQAAPPSPPDLGSLQVETTPAAELANLLEKATLEEIPLLAGLNLISIPEEPADSDPMVIFADIVGELGKVTAHNACDLTDPWKVYDPTNPAASDLPTVDHTIGMWVSANAATLLPTDGTLPASTTMELCEGWNLIGFPAGEPRHPHTALASIAGKWQRIFGYDAFDSEDPWEVFSVDVPDWANDLQVMQPGRGYWVLVNEAVTLEIRNQGPPPTVAISSPADLAVVTEPIEVVGTAFSDRLASWTLTSRAIGDGEAVTLATGTAPIADGTLATFDPTLLLNGLYELELTATDIQGQQVTESIAVSVEGQMKIGHFTLSFVDLAVPVSGLDIEIIRTYDSRDKQPRDFGVGWSLDIRQGSYRNNRAPGDGWQLQTSLVDCDTALESKSHLTVVRLSDSEVYRFALRLFSGAPSTGGGCRASARFDYVDGPLPGTTLDILGNDQVFWENGSNRVIDIDTFETFEPEDVRLTTRDGRVFEIDLNDGVTLVEDLNGNQLSITPADITHSSGESIVFDRDAEGRIIEISDPHGMPMSYAYDMAGDLVVSIDRAANSTVYTYDDAHGLLDIVDPLGNRAVRSEYDAAGRLTATTDAAGRTLSFDHDVTARRDVITDRLGFVEVMEYDGRGNVVREIDKLGNVTQRSFDGNDNLLTETDALGRTTIYGYTANNELASVTDALGNTTSHTYDGLSRSLTTTDPRGKVSTNTFDATGNLKTSSHSLGNITSFTYDSAGNQLTETDALGNIITFEYDTNGNVTREIDALGNEISSTLDGNGALLAETRTRTLPGGGNEALVTTYTYDALGRVETMTNAEGGVTRLDYNALGQVIRQIDPAGRVTQFAYDSRGHQTSITFPDATTETATYDDEGRLISQTDRAGRVTAFTFDATGRMLTRTAPDGSVTMNTYDAAGQLIAATDARGGVTGYAYDAAGRRTSVTDPLGNTFAFTYDAAGNQTSMIDPLGEITTFDYDDLNQRVATTFPDGTSIQSQFDALGRRVRETDQAGRETQFTFDALNRLVKVTDALGQATTHSFDEAGNHVTQTDANGNTTRFAYDRVGRMTSRGFPDGAVETSTYNPDGTRATRTDPNGTTTRFEYDADRNLIRQRYPDSTEVTYVYTPTGQRASYTDARGTTSFSYDARDRLISKTTPDGRSIGYAYDLVGNRTTMTATVGTSSFTTSYTYDALNRLATVTDSQGGVTSHSYDANGNLAAITHANSVVTTHAFDVLNRLTSLTTRDSVEATLQSYDFALAPTGHRTRIDEDDGTRRINAYDDLFRLTDDWVEDGDGTLIYRQTFTYDAVGNRLGRSDEQVAVVDTLYSYDSRDRLLTEDTVAHDWDPNGNLLSKSGSDGATYTWDFENRLAGVTLTDGTQVHHRYDPDGARVRTEVVPTSGPALVTDYLNDTSDVLSHVVVESSAGTPSVVYTRANDRLVSLFRPGSSESRTFHADGLGSVRLLTDETGAVTDRYAYTAFGEILEHEGDDKQPYRFAGEPFEPNAGFYYNRARWLDVTAGRFVSVDPLGGFRSDPRDLHRYLYAGADPVNMVDPAGLEFNFTSINTALGVLQVNIATALLNFRLALWSGAFVFPRIAGFRWEMVLLRWLRLFSRLKGREVRVALEELLAFSRGRIDIVLQNAKSLRTMTVEAKNVNLDVLARLSEGVRAERLAKLYAQAGRFTDHREGLKNIVYAFAKRPTTAAGLRTLETIERELARRGVDRITFGVQEFLTTVNEFLFK